MNPAYLKFVEGLYFYEDPTYRVGNVKGRGLTPEDAYKHWRFLTGHDAAFEAALPEPAHTNVIEYSGIAVNKTVREPLYTRDQMRAIWNARGEADARVWIPVAEKLPPPHTTFIALNRDGRVFNSRMCYGMHEPWFTFPHGDPDPSQTMPKWIDVTHWMLPAPPLSGG
jgi:hypothetical protein